MYQRARKFQENTAQSTDVIALMEEQLEAYLLAINSLSLLATKCAWVVIQAPPNAMIDAEVSHQSYFCYLYAFYADVLDPVSQATEAFKKYSRFDIYWG
jgi:hypothetical protein